MTAPPASSTEPHPDDPYAPVEINLKNAPLAALLAWLWPGAGHLYQQRYGKGLLFMVCILTTYFFGLGVGNGHVVYASFRKPDLRLPYILQVGVGLPALPALFQERNVERHQNRQAAPQKDGQNATEKDRLSRLMAPPANYHEHEYDELAYWYDQMGFFFELGTLFTMIAGLLNVLAICDAYGGPVFAHPNPKKLAATHAAETSPHGSTER